MVSLEGSWHSNPLRMAAMMASTTCDERNVKSVYPLTGADVVCTLMHQNQMMQSEIRLLRKKLRSLQDENVWASSELDKIHWEYQAALVELQWLYNQRVSVWNHQSSPSPVVMVAQKSPSPQNNEGAKTYAQTLQADEATNATNKPDSQCGERCIRHEPSARRQRRQCKCCVLEAIYRLVLSAPPGVQDVGEYVAAGLVNIPPFANFWCPGCTRDFVNQTPRRELESILHLVELIERGTAPMSELKRQLKSHCLRQRVKCAVHFKA